MTQPGPAADLIEHAAGIIAAKFREPHTAPYHWAGALWEAGMLHPPGTAPAAATTDPDAEAEGTAPTWDDVYAAIGQEVWKLAPQEFQDSGHRDLVFGTCWQNIMEAVQNGILAVAALPDEDGAAPC